MTDEAARAEVRAIQADALNDPRITDEQWATFDRLTSKGEHRVTYALYHAPDAWLMAGYLEIEVQGITYGIAPDGQASS